MSQENVEIVRALIETFNRGDLERLRNAVDPEIEWHDQPELPGATVLRGVEDTFAHLRSAMQDLPGYRIDVDALLDAGDVVVVCGRISARGRVSEAQVERPYFTAYTLQAGLVRVVRIFGTREEALKAAGVSA